MRKYLNKPINLPSNSIEATVARMLESSTLTSGFIATVLIISLMFCVITQIPVPDVLTYSVSTIIGFFFGSKTSDFMGRAITQVRSEFRQMD